MPDSENMPAEAEILKRLVKLEERVMTLEDSVSEVNDLELINKLDLVNMKSQMEKLRLGEHPRQPEEAPSRPKQITVVKKPSPPPKPKTIVQIKEVERPLPKNLCRHCGAWMPPAAKFCTKCGKGTGVL